MPVGILSGIFLSEFGHNRFADVLRFLTDVLTGVPSIIIGIVAYTLVVLPMHSFSALSGGIALSIIMIPTITRTTEEALRRVPGTLREASMGLGVHEWKTVLFVVLPAGLGGIVTGVMLAIARISGETAPLLFTAFGNRFWQDGLNKPIAALPLADFSVCRRPLQGLAQPGLGGGAYPDAAHPHPERWRPNSHGQRFPEDPIDRWKKWTCPSAEPWRPR